MSEVLIVAEHVDSHVSKPALELLTLARRLGEPVAVVFGETDDTIAKALGEYGATRVLSVTDPAIDDYLVAPKAEALAQIAAHHAAGRNLDHVHAGGQRNRRSAGCEARVRPDHRRHRHRRRRHHHAVGLCGQLDRHRLGDTRGAGDHRQTERRNA